MKIEIEWHETTIEAVMDFFAKGYRPHREKGETITNYEWVHDPRTGKIAVKLYIQKP